MIGRTLKAGAALLLALVVPSRAHAEAAAAAAATNDCVDTYDQAIASRKKGELVLAHAGFAKCTDPSCPGPVREECANQTRNLERVIPTVVFAARTPDGRELVDVRVEIDGRLLSQRVDGRAHRVDPGAHTFQFTLAGEPMKTIEVVLREGESMRRLDVVLGKAKARPIPVSAYVLAGVGALGLAGFGYFGLTGLSKESDLKPCKPNCSKEDSDDLKRTYLFADISLVIGLAGLGGATWVYLSSRRDHSPSGESVTTLGVRGAF